MPSDGSQCPQGGVQRATDDQPSRRAACDRCRAHKLRCLREESTTDVLKPCQRCSKAGATCSTGMSLRSGRPSKAREKQTKTSIANVQKAVDHFPSSNPTQQSSASTHFHDMAMETSPTWLLDWDNMLQPNRLQTSSETSNRSPHDHSDSRASNSQDHTSIPPSNLGTTMENSSYATIDSLDFESLLDLTQINSLGLLQDDAMDIEAQGYGTAHQTNYDIDPEIRGENFPPRHVNPPVKIPEPHLEIVDLKEEVLRRLADLHSGLLTNLNLMRNVGKCPCKHTARVSLASSQRNADGKTEEYNFLVGRMLNKSEEFISILQNFTPPVPSHSGSGLRGSGSESDPSDSDQGIMNAFTSSHKRSTPNGSDLAYFESPDSITNPSRPTLRCDVPMTLSILTCYVCLIRIYRTIFSSIYTALTIAKERKMDLPPLFPGLKLGGFAPHMNFQVQILVQISTNLLNKIDEALGLPDEHGQTKNGSGVLHQTGSAGLLQTMMKEEALEGLENGDPTKESPREIFRKLSLLC